MSKASTVASFEVSAASALPAFDVPFVEYFILLTHSFTRPLALP
jgi:hypothetical protein